MVMVVSNAIREQGYYKFKEWVNKNYKEPVFKFGYEEFNNLPEIYMDMICLHLVYKMTYREIGEIYGFSRSNAQAKLYQAFRRLNKGNFNIN